jgi:betaine-aldehyde dehydrogenase
MTDDAQHEAGGDFYHRPRLWIGGAWVAPRGGGSAVIERPFDRKVVGSAALGDEVDIDRAVAAARDAFDNGPWPRMRPAERAAALRRMGEWFAANADTVGQLVTDEMGASLAGMRRSGHAFKLMAEMNAEIAEAYSYESPRANVVGPTLVVKEPIGVVGVITPWNGPLFIIMLKSLPALAAGCTIVVKPSPETPLDAYMIALAAEAAGVPAGVVNVVPAEREASAHLVSHPGVDKISFTGSTGAGRAIGEACARDFRRVALELGGKSAAIFLEDADPVAAARTAIATGVAYNSGQACAALTRLLVPRNARQKFVDALIAEVRALKVGSPLHDDTRVSCMVSKTHYDRVLGYIEKAKAEGATALTGGGRPEDLPAELEGGYFVAPTLFDGITPEMTIAREEIFGPVAAIIDYEDEDDAIRIANDSSFGLGGAVFTANPARGLAVARRIRTGTVGINDYFISFQNPFGGVKASGCGREGGIEGFEAFLEVKTITGIGSAS